MKSNNLDDIIKKRKTLNTSFYFKIAIVIFGFLVLFSIPISLFYMGKVDGKSYEIKTNGEQYGKKEINITILIFMVLVNQYINLSMKLLIKKFLIICWIFQN